MLRFGSNLSFGAVASMTDLQLCVHIYVGLKSVPLDTLFGLLGPIADPLPRKYFALNKANLSA